MSSSAEPPLQQRLVDLLDELRAGGLVAVEGTLGQQVARRAPAAGASGQAARGTHAGQRGVGGARGRVQVGHHRPDHQRARAEPAGELARGGQRVAGAADHHHEPVALHPGEQVEPGPAGGQPAARR